MRTDQELIAKISCRDSIALSEFYDRHASLIYGALLRLLHDTDEAESILQDVFLHVMNKASKYKPELGSPKSWIVRIAHSHITNLAKSNTRQSVNDKVSIRKPLIDA